MRNTIFILLILGSSLANSTEMNNAQRPDVSSTTKPDMVFDGACIVTQSSGDILADGTNGFFPAAIISDYYRNIRHVELNIINATVSIVKGAQHGALVAISAEDVQKQGVGPESGPLYRYVPNTGYLGQDDATLLIELDGKRYKTHMKFYVVEEVNDNDWYEKGTPATLCAESQYKRID